MMSGTPSAASGPFVQDPGRVRALAADIAAKRLSPVALVNRYLERIAVADPHVQCWRAVDGERALAEARRCEAEAETGRLRGPLHGIPIAVKDVIDVEGLPTRANCKARANIAPATHDAEVILALRNRGAIILGKVHTTEFAFFDPSPARNPHNLAHTPGGSSSGSAAAVAGGMAPVAIGTQTVASVNRPAAYCGISAFKPSTGSISGFGMTPLAASYDTPGFYGWSVDDAAYVYEAVAPRYVARRSPPRADGKLTIVIPQDTHTDAASVDMKSAWKAAADAVSNAGHRVIEKASPISFARLFQIQRSTMLFETGRALKYLLSFPRQQIGEKLWPAIHEGLALDTVAYLDERAEIDRTRSAFFTAFPEADAFLWPAAPDTAPQGLAWTGDPRFISPWTALGGPVVTMPVGLAANRLPLGCLIAGRPGEDLDVARAARIIAEVAEKRD
jgi:aspartyl-tRNA(Asn)/glutamyl-tRNA(Gln) amidotransferase subunit A